LPGTNGWQAVLRDHLATFNEEDFQIDLQPLPYTSNALDSTEAVYRHWIRFENRGFYLPQFDGLRVPASAFVLANIEANGQVNMSVGRGRFFDPGLLAWWSQWDYAANPYGPGTTNSLAARRRAFVGAAVDLIMLDDLHRRDPSHYVRSDYIGGSLIWQSYTYLQVKDLLPPPVRTAYETGLRTIFGRLETTYPGGVGGGDMETFQLPGCWYAAEALDDDDLRARALARARYVLSVLIMPAGYDHHGWPTYDASYSGIALRFLTWAALLYNDPVISAKLEGLLRLKACQILPEPDGTNFFATYLGPSHFSTATAPGAPTDQWCTHFRDAAGAMQSDEALCLVFGARRYAIYAKPLGIRPDYVMRNELVAFHATVNNGQAGNNAATSLTNALVRTPAVWSENHWTEGLAYMGDYYRPGFYDRARVLGDLESPLTLPPFARRQDFITRFADDFLMVKLGDYGAILHAGPIYNQWAGHIAGLGGGSLSAFWTEKTGSVLLGLNRGSQNTNYEEWVSWSNWAVQAVSGLSSNRLPFSSARNKLPGRSFSIFGTTAAVMTVTGAIGPHDGAMSAPGGALTGQVAYARTFRADPVGLSVDSRLTSDGKDRVRELWEMIPLHLYCTWQTGTAVGVVSFQAGGQWLPGTNALVTNAAAVRIARFGESVIVAFNTPQRIKLADETWNRASSFTRNLMVDLLGSGGAAVPMPTATGVTYRLYVPAAPLQVRGDPGDYGKPAPAGYGRHTNVAYGISLTNTVPPLAGETNGVRHAAIGWTLAGPDWQPLESGSGTQTVFNLASNRVITWRWTNEFQVTVSASPHGRVETSVPNGWYREGESVTAAALPDRRYRFACWSGAVEAVQSTNNPVTLALDRPRVLQAFFQPAPSLPPGALILVR
jgi:hypothetical protein